MRGFSDPPHPPQSGRGGSQRPPTRRRHLPTLVSLPKRHTKPADGLSHPLWKKWKIDHRPRSSERRNGRCITRISEISPRRKTPKGKRRIHLRANLLPTHHPRLRVCARQRSCWPPPMSPFARACLCISPLPFPPTYPTRTST